MGYFGIPFRNGVPIGLGSVASFGAQQFDPSSLFIGGTAGTWYDPSDPTTLFTTSTGTTPCAVPGSGSQVLVGLMLDESQGAPGALGAELVTNGDFSQGSTGWTAGAGWSISSGQAVASAASTLLTQSGVFTAGKWYRVSFQQTYTSGSLQIRINGVQSIGFASFSGTITFNVYASASGQIEFVGTSLTSVIDNISVREIPGNHAIAFNDTTARPELSARVNLLTYSEQFDNAAWSKGSASVTANAIIAPDGTTTADAFVEDGSTNRHFIYRLDTTVSGTNYTISIRAKNLSRRYVAVGLKNVTASPRYSAVFDLVNGVVTASTSSGSPANTSNSIVSLGDGWFQISVSMQAASASTFVEFGLSNSATPSYSEGMPFYTGDGTSGIYIWGADLRPANIGSAIPSYQRIADQYTYDSNGFPSYLRFDGVDDSMYTPASINFSGTDKMSVFAGVRKLSDAARGIVVESPVLGGFNVNAPGAVAAAYSVFSSGTVGVGPTSSATNYAAPISNVLTFQSNISAPSMTLRVNTIEVVNDSGTQGTGNFNSSSLFIGSRNNSSLRFNGHLYSLIVAGTQLQSGSITATEQYVAGKTGVQI